MRLDKFLKVSRLVKRRTLAKEVCEQGRVFLNGRRAKAGTAVAIGDEVTIHYGQKRVTVRIERLKETSRREEATELYTLLKEEETSDERENYQDR